MIGVVSRGIWDAFWELKDISDQFSMHEPPQPKRTILKRIPSRNDNNDDNKGCGGIIIVIAVAVVIVGAIVAAITAALQWLDENIAFFLALLAFVASLILIGEAFAFLRRNTDRTEPEEVRAQLDQLRSELSLIQRQTGVSVDHAGDEEAEAASRPEPPEGNETS